MMCLNLNSGPLKSSDFYDICNTDYPQSLRVSRIKGDRVSIVKTLFEIQIWTIDDLAYVLNLTKGTIYNKVSKNEIPHYQKGKRGALYFIPSEILEWIKEGE